MYKVFSVEWAQAYHAAINASEAYAAAAANWREGRLAMVLRREADSVAVIADLHEGVCRGVASGTAEDAAEAAFVIEADESTWREVLDGKLAPLMGLMRGRLKLTRGSLAKLMPYTKAATALVDAAATIPTTF